MKETIKALREQNNYSQATVAKYLNISRQMYIKYESGDAEPPVKVVVGLCRLYKVDYRQIIDNLASEECPEEELFAYPYQDDSCDEMAVASPAVAYGDFRKQPHADSNFELVKTIIPKLTVFEQLKIISLLAEEIGKNGANGIYVSNSSCKKNMWKADRKSFDDVELDVLFDKYSGFLRGTRINDPKDARLNHLYEKYGV